MRVCVCVCDFTRWLDSSMGTQDTVYPSEVGPSLLWNWLRQLAGYETPETCLLLCLQHGNGKHIPLLAYVF